MKERISHSSLNGKMEYGALTRYFNHKGAPFMGAFFLTELFQDYILYFPYEVNVAQNRFTWDEREHDEVIKNHLINELKLLEPVARILVNRGITSKEDAEFHFDGRLSSLPDPFLIKGMDKACARIGRAIRRGERVIAWGDYDVDGITSLSLIVNFFKMISYPIGFDIPRRLEDGYGLNKQAIKKHADKGINLIITVDNGITSIEEVDYAASLGVDVVIVDHHEMADKLPEASAIIDPKQPGCNFANGNLAAVGLTFMLLAGLRRHLVNNGLLTKESLPNLKDFLDIVALGTVADMVPLLGLNRLLVRHGLQILSRNKRAGVLALKEVSKMDVDADVDSYHVGFQLAPRINAGGRLGDAVIGVNLLTANDIEFARQYAYALNKNNNFRRKLEQNVLDEAIAILEEEPDLDKLPILILAKEGWHEGVIGLVASKIMDTYHKPAIVMGINKQQIARGSCRSIKSLHIQQLLTDHSKHLVQFGGHAMAAGLTIKAKDIAAFRKAVIKDLENKLGPDDFIPHITTDGELSLDQLSYELLDQFETLAPFGIGNPAPVFIARNVEVAKAKLLKDKHWKLGLISGKKILEGIGFNMSDYSYQKGDLLDIVYVPEYNTFRGNKTIQIRLKDTRRSNQ